MGRLSENSVVVMKNKSFSITAELEVPEKGAEGVIIAQGGKFGGMSLYTKGGKAKFAYNFFGLQTFTTEATQAIPTGKHQVRMEFKYDGGGLARGGGLRCTTTARRSAKAGSSAPCQCSSPPMRPRISAAKPARR